MADKLFDVLLNLRAKFFVRADEKSKKLTEELSDWAILNVPDKCDLITLERG